MGDLGDSFLGDSRSRDRSESFRPGTGTGGVEVVDELVKLGNFGITGFDVPLALLLLLPLASVIAEILRGAITNGLCFSGDEAWGGEEDISLIDSLEVRRAGIGIGFTSCPPFSLSSYCSDFSGDGRRSF